MKKVLSLFLVLSLTLILMTPNIAEAAVKISKAKATMEVDSTLKLKVTGTTKKITWSSSKKSVATVNSSGTVTAKAEGQATITAKIDSNKYNCEITVVNSNKTKFDDILSAGEYEVGVDIPAGKYNIECLIGTSTIFIYKNSRDYENDEFYSNLILMASKDSLDYEMYPNLYTPTYKNLTLKKGNYIIIDKSQISFKTK